MKSKLHILFFIACLISYQSADAQLFKRLKEKAKQKAKNIENKVINKIDNKVEKTIDDAIEEKEDSKKETSRREDPTATKEKDFGDVTINHSKTYGSVTLTETRQIKVDKTNSGYTIYGNWWSHKADIYDGFMIVISTTQNLKDSNTGKQTFKIPEEATLKLGYDPELPFKQQSVDGFSRAVTDDYQKYEIAKGEVTIDVLSDENIKISFSGTASLTKRTKNPNSEFPDKTFYDATISGNIDSKTPLFQNQETIVKQDGDKKSKSYSDTMTDENIPAPAPGTYLFSSEVVTEIRSPKENRSHKISYLLHPKAKYIAIKADLGAYSDEEMEGESIIVMDQGNTHVFVESNGMKMRMSNGMMGQENMSNLTDQMAQYDYTKLQKTGNTKTILGATCYEYAMADSSTKVNFWVAPSIKLSNWFIQDHSSLDGYIMEYTIQSNKETMTSTTIAIKNNINKTINPKEYKKMF